MSAAEGKQLHIWLLLRNNQLVGDFPTEAIPSLQVEIASPLRGSQ